MIKRRTRRPATVPATSRARGDYKGVWNSVSEDEDHAKAAVAGYTDESRFRDMADATVSLLEGTVGIQPTDVFLEIGAGVGRVGPALAPRVKRWIATDVSENMLVHARRRCEGLDNVDFIAVNGWDLQPVPDESVDVVYCTVVFMHLDEWDRYGYVKEAMRVLRPGGRVYVDNVNLLGDDGWAFFLKTAHDYQPLERPANVSKTSTPQELRAFLEHAGFVDITLKTSSTFVWAYGKRPD